MIERMKNQKDALKPDDATMNYVSHVVKMSV